MEECSSSGFLPSAHPAANGLHSSARQMYGGQRFPYAQVSSLSLSLSQFLYCIYTQIYYCYRFKVSGELPLLHVKISDHKIQGVLGLVDSIPLPQSSSSPPTTPTEKVRETLELETNSRTFILYWHASSRAFKYMVIYGNFLIESNRHLMHDVAAFCWKPWKCNVFETNLNMQRFKNHVLSVKQRASCFYI